MLIKRLTCRYYLRKSEKFYKQFLIGQLTRGEYMIKEKNIQNKLNENDLCVWFYTLKHQWYIDEVILDPLRNIKVTGFSRCVSQMQMMNVADLHDLLVDNNVESSWYRSKQDMINALIKL